MAKNFPIKVSLSFILQSNAKQESEAFINKWSKYKNIINGVVFISLTEYDLETGVSKVVGDTLKCDDRFVCARPWHKVFIHPDGNVSACCQMTGQLGWGAISFGNLYDMDMSQIWNSEKMRRLREENLDMSFSEFSICRNCTEWALSYAEESETEFSSNDVKIVSLQNS